jgi:hypothetical protein
MYCHSDDAKSKNPPASSAGGFPWLREIVLVQVAHGHTRVRLQQQHRQRRVGAICIIAKFSKAVNLPLEFEHRASNKWLSNGQTLLFDSHET